MAEQQYQVGDMVLMNIDKDADYAMVGATSGRLATNGKIGTIKLATESGSNWYYKINNIGNGDYFHERMLAPANLSLEEAESRLVRGLITYDVFRKVTGGVSGGV